MTALVTRNRPAGAPARFAPDPRRRALIAKLHLAKKQLGLADDDYRAILREETGRDSAGDCDERQLARALKRFERQGFKPAAPSAAGRARQADHPSAKKARALWISLWQLGAVETPAEAALEAFAARQLGCEKLQWADGAQLYKLIEALKAMANRAGWRQELKNVPPADHARELLSRLVDAQWARLQRDGKVAPGGSGHAPLGLGERASIERLRGWADAFGQAIRGEAAAPDLRNAGIG